MQAACLAKCNGANVALHRAGTFSLEELRQAVVDVCSSGEEHLVVSYSRKTFSQTGDGHFSPVGGYHAGRDLVLILDTVRITIILYRTAELLKIGSYSISRNVGADASLCVVFGVECSQKSLILMLGIAAGDDDCVFHRRCC